MNRRRIYNVVGCFVALVAFVNVANAQSKDRANPTKLTSNEISGPIDSDSRGNFYYYSFWANPGEIVITLTVEPGSQVGDSASMASVRFSVFDRNAEEVANKEAVTYPARGTEQAVARIEVTRRQLMVLGVTIPGGAFYKTVGGKYRIRINGTVEIGKDNTGISDESLREYQNILGRPECLPNKGKLIVKMKDGARKIIDLSEAETVTVVP